MKKKGMSQMWWIIATAIIVILIVIFILIWFKGSGGSAFDAIDEQLKDTDKDGVTNVLDQCPDTKGVEVDSSGCPEEQVT